MPPKKRTSSGSTKKSTHQNNNLHLQQQQQQQQSQPSKFGIQHFFERHTQNTLSHKSKSLLVPHSSNSNSLQNPKESSSVSLPKTPRNVVELRCLDSNETNSAAQKSGNGSNLVSQVKSCGDVVELDKNDVVERCKDKESSVILKNDEAGTSSQSSIPTEIVVAAGLEEEKNQAEVTPEFCKSVSLTKRFKFSPGMLIKQSQDDGGDEVTWRISPVNERLHAMSKQLPNMVKVLADSSRFNSLNIQECSLKKTPPESERKFEKWLYSPAPKALDKSLVCSNRASLRKRNTDHSMDLWENNGNSNCQTETEVTNSQSPFQTPPSLTYGNDKPANVVDPNEATDQLGSRQHKKALIELLDQVEDVISVEQESTIYFLVLEVSEKHGQVETSGSQCSFKVLRLLNEQSGEERVLHLRDEWCYSVVAPGDAIHVIGEFDSEGKCEINRGKNFLIVHPDILVSGTRVAGSFSCSRRTVLDERLKSSEYSAAALIGTLLHQMFQVLWMKNSLSFDGHRHIFLSSVYIFRAMRLCVNYKL